MKSDRIGRVSQAIQKRKEFESRIPQEVILAEHWVSEEGPSHGVLGEWERGQREGLLLFHC